MGGKKKESKAEMAAEASNAKSAAAAKAAEDASWGDDGPKKSKSQAKKADKDGDRADAAAKKSEAKALAAAEDAEMASYGKKKPKADVKVTAAERAAKREEEIKAQQALIKKKEKESRREQTEDDYGTLVDTKYDNRAVDVEARSLDSAVSQMENIGLGGKPPEAPTVSRKAAYAAYEERMLAELKGEQPNLKMSQYKDMVFKSWKKAPENPANQC